MRSMATMAESGGTRNDHGAVYQFPQVFLDPVLRAVVIAGRHYPMERVVCFERARMALSRLPDVIQPAEYIIGPRDTKS